MKLRPGIVVLIMTIAGLLAMACGVIFVSSETEEITEKISSVFFVSLAKNKPVFLHIPALEYYTHDQEEIWQEAEQEHPDNSVDLFHGGNPRNFDILTELQAIAILNDLAQTYPYRWEPEYTRVESPDGGTGGAASEDGNKRTYSTAQLVEIFETNTFHHSLANSLGLVLPPNTLVTYLPGDENKRTVQIKFSELLTYEATITLQFSSYRAGLGNAAQYITLTQPINEWDVDLSKQGSYGIVVIDILCTANFFTPFPHNPKVDYYRKWFAGMFDHLHRKFDWQRCDHFMENYNEMLGNQKFGEIPDLY